jgi:transcriptional regulator with XRE-family HTH domain
MIVGDPLRDRREHKKLSQGDIEKRTSLLCCYISRVECGHTAPAVETLGKFARGLEVPIYQLFYEGEEPPELPKLPKRKRSSDIVWRRSVTSAVCLVFSQQQCGGSADCPTHRSVFFLRRSAPDFQYELR